jgi:hypothetical protein
MLDGSVRSGFADVCQPFALDRSLYNTIFVSLSVSESSVMPWRDKKRSAKGWSLDG